MKKTDYLISSFNNIQELVRFTDQKIAAVLVICGIQLTFFFEFAKDLKFGFVELFSVNSLIFLVGFAYGIIIITILFLSIFFVLKPAFAKFYKPIDYSCYYYEHIANNYKDAFYKKVKEHNKKQRIKEISDQIFEISHIAKRKNRFCVIIMYLLFLSIVSLLVFIFLVNFTKQIL